VQEGMNIYEAALFGVVAIGVLIILKMKK